MVNISTVSKVVLVGRKGVKLQCKMKKNHAYEISTVNKIEK